MSLTVAVDAAAPPVTAPHTVTEALTFRTPPPGMPGLHDFSLTALDDSGFLFALRSLDQPDVRLFVVPPRPYFPEYAPLVDEGTAASLGLDVAEVLLLVVVHPGQDGHPPTANLLAPVALNPITGAAVQVVLDSDEWPLRAPLTASTRS